MDGMKGSWLRIVERSNKTYPARLPPWWPGSVGDPSRGDVLATTLMALTIGLQSMSRTASAEDFFALYTIVDTAMDVERGVYTPGS
ncbi:MAG: hypothetical protein HKN37_02110 [Rhodothermales bacterium]|nr:hypothetical protein [Rhodothermales bacterium]